MMKLLPLLLALFACQLLMPMQALATLSYAQAYRMLKADRSPIVHELPCGEREILMAMLALEAGRSSEALDLLDNPSVGKDPVASRIRAEAYRRQSIQAAVRAGKYAHAVAKDIDKLKHAGIELAPAKQRLQAFIDRVEGAAGQIFAVAAHPGPSVIPQAHNSKVTLLASVRRAIDSWRRDWQSRNADAYLSHYDAQFGTGKYDFASWSAYKRRVNGKKSYIRIGISKFRLISGPARVPQGEAVLVGFKQQYKSSNYSANGSKQLYLVRKRPGAPWLILSEGNVVHVPVVARQRVEHDGAAIGPLVWTINLASFTSFANAEKMLASLQIPGTRQPFVASTVVKGKTVYRIRFGMYARRGEAADAMPLVCAKPELVGCWLEQVKK